MHTKSNRSSEILGGANLCKLQTPSSMLGDKISYYDCYLSEEDNERSKQQKVEL